MTRFVSIKQVAEHLGMRPDSVVQAMKAEDVEMQLRSRRIGYRVELDKANTFLARRYPEAGRMSAKTKN